MNENIHKTPQLVRDLMTVGVTICTTDTPVTTIAEAILEKDLEAIVVLAEEGHALGIVSQDELIGAYGRENYSDLTAGDILHEGVPQIPTDIPLRAAAQMMKDEAVARAKEYRSASMNWPGSRRWTGRSISTRSI